MTSAMPRPGDRVGPYRLLEVAGEGGMGVVYRAADTLLHDRVVAVKVMAAHLSAEPAYRAAFLHEAQVAAEVSHPHVVPVHAAGEADGLLYLAMAWIDGRDLRAIATAGGLSVARAITVVRQVARALDALHEAGIVHGDVKPSNVLVHRADGEDHAYLVDFGVARRTEFADARTNELVGGTPAYSAPETTGHVPSPASDRYSLGCVVFELLTGERPFGGGDARLLARRHAELPRPRVSDFVPELASFDDVLMRAIARDPAERFPSGAALGRALEQAQQDAAEPATLVMLPTRHEETPTPAARDRDATGRDAARRETRPTHRPPPPRSTRPAPGPRRPRRRRAPIAVAATALVAVAVAIGLLATHAGGNDGQRTQDATVVARLVDNYARALDTGNADLLARTVSAGVVRTGTDGIHRTCVTDTGSKDALAVWAAQLGEIKSYRLTRTSVQVDSAQTAHVTAQSAINGETPATTDFQARLEAGNVWRLTRVKAPCNQR